MNSYRLSYKVVLKSRIFIISFVYNFLFLIFRLIPLGKNMGIFPALTPFDAMPRIHVLKGQDFPHPVIHGVKR